MKAIKTGGGFFRNAAVVSARAMIVAGILFAAVNGFAQIPPGGGGGGSSDVTNTPLQTWSFSNPTNWPSDSGYLPIVVCQSWLFAHWQRLINGFGHQRIGMVELPRRGNQWSDKFDR